jgi:hypothetical protein
MGWYNHVIATFATDHSVNKEEIDTGSAADKTAQTVNQISDKLTARLLRCYTVATIKPGIEVVKSCIGILAIVAQAKKRNSRECKHSPGVRHIGN